MTPRLLSRANAAKHCGLPIKTFSEWVKTGRLPPPIEGTRYWDRAAIEAALNHLSGLVSPGGGAPTQSALEEWKEKRRGAGQAIGHQDNA